VQLPTRGKQKRLHGFTRVFDPHRRVRLANDRHKRYGGYYIRLFLSRYENHTNHLPATLPLVIEVKKKKKIIIITPSVQGLL
jgi:hypothetical protein